jgi:hypothetical protein
MPSLLQHPRPALWTLISSRYSLDSISCTNQTTYNYRIHRETRRIKHKIERATVEEPRAWVCDLGPLQHHRTEPLSQAQVNPVPSGAPAGNNEQIKLTDLEIGFSVRNTL